MKRDDDGEFLERLRETPIGQKVVSAIADTRTASRAAAIERLATVRTAAAAEYGQFAQAFAALRGSFDRLKRP